MRKPFFAILFFVASAVWGSDSVDPCGPCRSDSVKSCSLERVDQDYVLTIGRGSNKTSFLFGGWVEAGAYTNGNGGGNNGPQHAVSNRTTEFSLDQLYWYGEKVMNRDKGFDWGARIDMMYGIDASSAQCYGDHTFDYGWGGIKNRYDDEGWIGKQYGVAMYQLYATLGYKKFQAKVGKFITPIGWESAASRDNFFYSHSYCYWMEAATNSGVLADYDLTDKLTVSAGWTAGEDSSIGNRFGDSAVLIGLTWKLTRKATVYYWMNNGHKGAGTVTDWDDPFFSGEEVPRFIDDSSVDYFMQSLCVEWKGTDRFTYVFQYNVRNDHYRNRYTDDLRGVMYGINNHFLYKINDRWSVGLRAEWYHENYLGYVWDFAAPVADFYEITLGLNWNPTDRLRIRPEIRYDWVNGNFDGNEPCGYKEKRRRDQVTGGVGLVYVF